ncbi:hypothetical protein O3P69_008043 [Scylla paramamosain]|uniref:Uncharacterized protein n=1 Tax=Scylla paramamosain TaxID=85552 RepID=A0AAW0T0J4_SCYPA
MCVAEAPSTQVRWWWWRPSVLFGPPRRQHYASSSRAPRSSPIPAASFPAHQWPLSLCLVIDSVVMQAVVEVSLDAYSRWLLVHTRLVKDRVYCFVVFVKRWWGDAVNTGHDMEGGLASWPSSVWAAGNEAVAEAALAASRVIEEAHEFAQTTSTSWSRVRSPKPHYTLH